MFKELYNSYIECSKNKSNTINTISFIIEKEKKLIALKHALQDRIYTPGKSIYFVVTHPKAREVFAADFVDRIIHHFFVRGIEKNFYTDLTNSAYSCLKNRGTHKCIEDIKKIYSDYRYYLQIDIRNFFMSINKDILYKQLLNYLPKDKNECKKPDSIDFQIDIYKYLLEVILDHNPTKNCIYKGKESFKKLIPNHKSLFYCPPGVGMPIGNYSSQFFANVYLNGLDKYILNELGIKHYFRYVDDLVIFHNDYKKLQNIEYLVDNYLQTHLNMQLAREKTHLKQTSHGLDFLGYFIKPHTTYTRKRVKNNLIQKLENIKTDIVKYYDFAGVKFKIINFQSDFSKKLLTTFASYMGHLKHTNARHLIKKIIYTYSFLQYFFDFSGKILSHIKYKRFKNNYIGYKYYENLYKNTIIFYPTKQYYIFPKRYLYLLGLQKMKYIQME